MAEQDQNTFASMLSSVGEKIADAFTRSELEPENGSLSVHTLPSGRKVVVQGAVRDESGRLIGGRILDKAGSSPDKTGTSIAETINFGGNFKNGGSVRTKMKSKTKTRKKMKNFKGTF
tara:strand:+ start:543 stop:896 length:354 start_codon:yes stop_codon:yes gene_type:complete